jgi:hypothetical protein
MKLWRGRRRRRRRRRRKALFALDLSSVFSLAHESPHTLTHTLS